MKVPIYQSQTRLPQRTGAGQLSVQANPQAMSAVGRAQASMGQTLVAGGLNLWGDFLKVERAAEQVDEESHFSRVGQGIYESILEGPEADVGKWTDLYALPRPDGSPSHLTFTKKSAQIRNRLNLASQTQLSGIEDRAVRARVTASNGDAISTRMTQINALLRSKYLAWAKQKMKAHHFNMVKKLSDLPPGETKKNLMEQHKATLGYFAELVPFLGDDYMYNASRNFESDVGSLAIRKAIVLAQDSEGIKKLLDQVREPKPGHALYDDINMLSAPRRQKFVEELQADFTRLERGEIATANRESPRIERERKLDQLKTFERVRMSIVDDREANKPPVYSVQKIHKLGRALSESQRQTLIRVTTGQDAIYNQTHVSDLKTQILDAFTDEDLDDIEEGYRKDFAENRIGLKAHDELQTALVAARTKTPEYREIKKYSDLLASAMTRSTLAITSGAKYLKNARNAEATFAGNEAKLFFSNEIESGARPVEAYYDTIERFASDQKMVAVNIVKGLPAEILRALPETVAGKKGDVAKITTENAEAAMEAFRDLARSRIREAELPEGVTVETPQEELGALQRREKKDRRISKDQRMTVRDLIIVEERIEFLQAYAADKTKAATTDDGAEVKEKIKTLDKAGADDLVNRLFEKFVEKFTGDKRRDRSGE
mgnify:FL=1